MTDNIIDFERQRESHVQKRKEARVEALRRAFRSARGDKADSGFPGKPSRSRKPRK